MEGPIETRAKSYMDRFNSEIGNGDKTVQTVKFSSNQTTKSRYIKEFDPQIAYTKILKMFQKKLEFLDGTQKIVSIKHMVNSNKTNGKSMPPSNKVRLR
jgi:hypothetical protein